MPAAEASILKLHTKPVLSYQVPIFGAWPQNISAAEKNRIRTFSTNHEFKLAVYGTILLLYALWLLH
jgi:hypothetical protein